MVVIAANTTADTSSLLREVIEKNEDIRRFGLKNKLNLQNTSVLIRTAMINLYNHLPTSEEIVTYRSAVLNPHEFDDYWRKELGLDADLN